jgi:ATP-dependent Lon protease
MTGEITLRGEVLPIGGLKEKILAAKGAGITRVVMPKQNRRDLNEVPRLLRSGIELYFVDHMEEVLRHSLFPPLEAALPQSRVRPDAAS